MGNTTSDLGDPRSEEYAFMQSVYTGDVNRVSTLITKKPDIVTLQSKDYQNAWHFAAAGGHLKILELLLKDPAVAARRTIGRGADCLFSVDQQNKKGQTPLMLACEQGYTACVEFLLKCCKADAWIADIAGSCAIHYAALKGHADCLKALLEDPTAPPSGVKCKYVDVRNRSGLTPLHCAVHGGHVEAARVMLSAGCRLVPQTAIDTLEQQVSCNGGSTPLHLAVMRGDAELVRILMATYVKILEDGLDGHGIACPDPRSVPDNYSMTPYLIATKWGHENVAPLLDPMTPLDITPKSPNKTSSLAREASFKNKSSDLPSVPSSAPNSTAPHNTSTAATMGSGSVVNITVTTGSEAEVSGGSASGGAAGSTASTTAWMEDILNRVVPESSHSITLPSRGSMRPGGG